jgi:hypothetical protein
VPSPVQPGLAVSSVPEIAPPGEAVSPAPPPGELERGDSAEQTA